MKTKHILKLYDKHKFLVGALVGATIGYEGIGIFCLLAGLCLMGFIIYTRWKK